MPKRRKIRPAKVDPSLPPYVQAYLHNQPAIALDAYNVLDALGQRPRGESAAILGAVLAFLICPASPSPDLSPKEFKELMGSMIEIIQAEALMTATNLTRFRKSKKA